ncbi:copia protein [Tanacetum coccineum]
MMYGVSFPRQKTKPSLVQNGVVSRNKARLVAQGYNQQEGTYFDETYAPVARLESIRILLAYACAHNFKLYQMDVKSAFLNRFINEEVYVAQPPRFIDSKKPNHVFKLKKALYGLKQAPKAWYDRLKAFLIDHEYNIWFKITVIYYEKKLTYHHRSNLCLWYPKGTGLDTTVYADSDHAGDYVDRKSTSGVCTFMGCCLTSWFSKKQTALSISTTKAEYVSAGKACQQALWMKQALIDYDIKLDDIPVLCDNKGAIDLSKNPISVHLLRGSLPIIPESAKLVINDLKKCGYKKDNCELNSKLLNNLQPEWKQYGTLMRQTKNLMDINIDSLYNILKQNEGDVNDAMSYKKQAVVATSDPLALVAEKKKLLHRMATKVLEKDLKITKNKKEKYKSLALKARQVLSDADTSSSDSNDEEYAMAVRYFKKFFRRRGKFVRQPYDDKKNFRKIKEDKREDQRCFKCGDPNHFISDCPKNSFGDQKAFVVRSWNNSGDDSKKEEICLMAHSNEVRQKVKLDPDEWIQDSDCTRHMTGNKVSSKL